MRGVKLDRIDRRILRDLQADGRMTNVDLAERAGISAPPCLRRVRALERAGVIRGYHADISPAALGYNVTVFAQVGLSSQAEQDLRAFEALVNTWPEVRECHMLAGETDFLLKVVAADWDAYQRFLTTQLTTAPNVNHVRSSLAIRTAKWQPGVPVSAECVLPTAASVLRARPPAVWLVLAGLLAADPRSAWAATGAPALDGTRLGLAWGVPFLALLAAIALLPVAAPSFWHRHYGKVANLCALGFLVPCAVAFGFDVALYEFLHTMLLEYVPFVVLLLALFTVAGGVRIKGTFVGTPALNTFILAIGTILASWMGTTGACMLLIRPLIQANGWRARSTHVFVFFIFLVGNIGGALTPLGDPPLFIGFLKGVDFFWVTARLLGPMLVVAVPLLAVFFVLDSLLYRREGSPPAELLMAGEAFGIEGKRNLALLAAVVAIVLTTGVWESGLAIDVFYIHLALDEVARSVLLLVIVLLSWRVTVREIRARNQFTWFPIVEVAKLFFGIFVTIVPVIAVIRAGGGGIAHAVVALVNPDGRPDEAMYFWVTGLMSSVLDNAPTYLIFFNLAGGDEQALMGQLAGTLIAISAGSVFMGAFTYIGNAPNFLVRTIAAEGGIRMPSFFGFVAWAVVFLVPLFVLVTLVFLR